MQRKGTVVFFLTNCTNCMLNKGRLFPLKFCSVFKSISLPCHCLLTVMKMNRDHIALNLSLTLEKVSDLLRDRRIFQQWRIPLQSVISISCRSQLSSQIQCAFQSLTSKETELKITTKTLHIIKQTGHLQFSGILSIFSNYLHRLPDV